MFYPLTWRRGLIWIGTLLAVLMISLTLFIAALDAGYFRGALISTLEASSGRHLRVEGPLRLHLFSQHPQMIAEGLIIENPAWTAPGVTAEIGKLTVILQPPRLGHLLAIESLSIEAATLYLVRDSTAHANWQRHNPDERLGAGPPLMHALSMVGAHVLLDDAFRNVHFDGKISVLGEGNPALVKPLRIEGRGELNGRTVMIELTGDPLATARLDEPYHFSVAEQSSGSILNAKGFLLKPFDVKGSELTFEASGEDLRDLHYLTGTTLVNTGRYHLSGKMSRRGMHTTINDLVATFGQSDVHGTVAVETIRGRSKIDANLSSDVLRTADVGLRAAGRLPDANAELPLFTSNPLVNPAALRRRDAEVSFHVRRFDIGSQSMHSLAGKLALDLGVLTMTSTSANVLDGQLSLRLKIDARTELPTTVMNLKLKDVQLQQAHREGKGAPPLEGPLSVQADLTGQGSSPHQIAASATGSVTAVLPTGTLRASLAELTGIDLRGLGLLLSKSKEEDSIRCGLAKFEVRSGLLAATDMLLDTEPVLISGAGTVNLGTEALDLELTGHPKGVRILRLRAPILIRGSLKHPTIAIDAHDSKLVLIDRGHTKDTDCAALLAADAAPSNAPNQ
jgi:AsmA family protein